MSKLLNKYKECKLKDETKVYMFESGIFYIFVNEDAKMVSDKINLKLTNVNDYYKCGFPIKSKDKYFTYLTDNNIDFELVKITDGKSKIINDIPEKRAENEIIRKLKSINVEYLMDSEAKDFLYELKELIK